MALILENARLTNDSSEQTYTITIADGKVKSIVPTSSESPSVSSDSDAERIDVKGDYVGQLAHPKFTTYLCYQLYL